MDLTRVKLNLLNVGNTPRVNAPKLDQLIKPEIDNIKQQRFIPKPHPPISKRKMPSIEILPRA